MSICKTLLPREPALLLALIGGTALAPLPAMAETLVANLDLASGGLFSASASNGTVLIQRFIVERNRFTMGEPSLLQSEVSTARVDIWRCDAIAHNCVETIRSTVDRRTEGWSRDYQSDNVCGAMQHTNVHPGWHAEPWVHIRIRTRLFHGVVAAYHQNRQPYVHDALKRMWLSTPYVPVLDRHPSVTATTIFASAHPTASQE